MTLACAFEPQRVVVDRDVTVAMPERQKTEVKLKPALEKGAMRQPHRGVASRRPRVRTTSGPGLRTSRTRPIRAYRLRRTCLDHFDGFLNTSSPSAGFSLSPVTLPSRNGLPSRVILNVCGYWSAPSADQSVRSSTTRAGPI